MSKRNISYIKPQDPSFLQKLKAQIGYKDGPDVDTKRQKLEDLDTNSADEGDYNKQGDGEGGDYERDDEKPQIVVIKSGDLTAEEAEAEKRRIEKEEAEKPADLSQRIIFKTKAKIVDETSVKLKKDKKLKKSAVKEAKSKLSFAQEDEEEEDF
ncbi:uncharacterized protein KIAA1143 homolog [Episyrphus balteatus]|uniref:uncharacterized protein KIAA1143 homolog n=1 Tax=Episyrphus balteatus TaxID=286459 RepID=UPI002486811C|nr:uncharacterized protein KIAA1143 homolog [Episyrphus balteatus]